MQTTTRFLQLVDGAHNVETDTKLLRWKGRGYTVTALLEMDRKW